MTSAESLNGILVLAEVRKWLTGEAASGATDEHDLFQLKWDALEVDDRAILAALIAEGGRDIKEQSVRHRLIKHHGFEKNRASAAHTDSSEGVPCRNRA